MTDEQKKREYRKLYYQEHRSELVEYAKRYREKYREKYLEQAKKCRIKHKNINLEYNRTYYYEHKEQRSEYNKSYHKYYQQTKNGRASNLCGSYKAVDKEFNLGECTLTTKWIVDNIFSGQTCHWCGETDWLKLGCDRIDNTKPHTPDNVVPSCWHCNHKRNGASYEFFKMMHTPVTVKVWK